MNNLKEQKPATKNQISNSKPDVLKNSNILQGYIANSMNGGHLKCIEYVPIMAGQRIVEFRIQKCIKLLTPKTPSYQTLKCRLSTYFVPNKRVWPNAEKFTSQKGGTSVNKISEIPNLGGYSQPILQYTYTDAGTTKYKNIRFTDTDLFRDSYISGYLPRYDSGKIGTTQSIETALPFPKISVLPLRGFKAIYNDFERNKEYDTPLTEYTTDTCSQQEFNDYFRTADHYNIIRGKRQNSYYTDYRTELLGAGVPEPTTAGSTPADYALQMVSMVEWEKRIAEYRSESLDSQLNDWDVIAKIRGSKKLTEGKVQLLSTKVFPLNYSAVTQSTYNVNSNISPEFQAMGTQGAYSYTEIDMPLIQWQEFNEEGYLHVIMQVTADSVFETGVERTSLNVGAMDIYRPDNKELKNDVLYDIEKGTTGITNSQNIMKITGFKRKFSEYFKLPDCIGGDITSNDIYATTERGNGPGYDELTGTAMITKKSFQFFEISDKFSDQSQVNNYAPMQKSIWKDYTDLLINQNQAIQYPKKQTGLTSYAIELQGENQIFFVGIATMITDLPIDESIKNNYTKWGEK